MSTTESGVAGICACGAMLIEPYPDGRIMCFECRHKENTQFIAERLPADDLYVRSSQQDGKIRFAAWLGGRVVGEMTITVEPLVHDMTIQEGTLQRKIADALFQYASGYVRASGFSEALVLVSDDNVKMQRYVEARSTPEEPSKVYLLEVK